MHANECLFLVQKRSCGGHHQKTGIDPTAVIGRIEIPQCTDLEAPWYAMVGWQTGRGGSAPFSEQFRSGPRTCRPLDLFLRPGFRSDHGANPSGQCGVTAARNSGRITMLARPIRCLAAIALWAFPIQ